MRTFQLSDATSHKFWNIEVKDKTFTVTFGKIGTNGQSQIKTFKDAATAQSEADKLIKEKTKKGYVETTPKASAPKINANNKPNASPARSNALRAPVIVRKSPRRTSPPGRNRSATSCAAGKEARAIGRTCCVPR